ncbi:hypothetical protein PM082_006844 [Marasmius tenuissimus]|nr:hypothetical protein PM082_006844 [Marasmius tenuissimus]
MWELAWRFCYVDDEKEVVEEDWQVVICLCLRLNVARSYHLFRACGYEDIFQLPLITDHLSFTRRRCTYIFVLMDEIFLLRSPCLARS